MPSIIILTQNNLKCMQTITCAIGLELLKKMTFETHAKCLSCMIGKATLEDFPKSKRLINKRLYQVHMDSFSSSVESTAAVLHAIVFVDAATGFRWIHGMKTKDDAIEVLQTWYTDIADL